MEEREVLSSFEYNPETGGAVWRRAADVRRDARRRTRGRVPWAHVALAA